jgi:hypothetical protein
MPNVTQLNVMDQRGAPGGHESCGYHTLKNALLSLMWSQKLINDQKFETLSNDEEFFKAIFNAAKTNADHYGNQDLTLPTFQALVQKIKNGTFDFSKYGITKEAIQALNFDQHLISLQTYTWPNIYPIGHSGELLDMEAALALAKLARIDGEAHRVFALGLNNEHWVTAVLNQDKKSARTWRFMDSWGNQSTYKKSSINKIESILNKNEQELRDYLLAAYEAWNELCLYRRYNTFFDSVTGKPKNNVHWLLPNNEQVLWSASDYFVKNKKMMQDNLEYILIDFQFAQGAGWLTNPNDREKEKLKILYQIAQFMLDNAENTALDKKAKVILEPICERLNEVLSPSLVQQTQHKKQEQKRLLPPQEVQAEVKRIKDNRYSVREYFQTLSPILLPEELPHQERLTVLPTLVDEDNLKGALNRDYPGKEFVVMFYTHKPHSSAVSPYYPEQFRAHTSVLLCQVRNGKIQDTLNIDSYNNLGFFDIMGERSDATPNPNIKQRLVLTAGSTSNKQVKRPLQTPSWDNMNCPLYALTITQQLLKLYQNNHDVLNNVFDDSLQIGTEANKKILEEAILNEMVASQVYVTRTTAGEYLTNPELTSKHHHSIREKLAAAFIQQNNPDLQNSHKASQVEQHTETTPGNQNQENKPLPQSSGLEARPEDMSWDVYLLFSELYQQKNIQNKQKLYEYYLIATNYQDRYRTLNGTSIAQLINKHYPYLKEKLDILDELSSEDSIRALTQSSIKELPLFVRDKKNFASLSDVDSHLKAVLSELQKILTLDPDSLKKKLEKIDDIGAVLPINAFLNIKDYIQNNPTAAKKEHLSSLRTAFKTIIACKESLRSESKDYSQYFVTLEQAMTRLLYEMERATYNSAKKTTSIGQDINQNQRTTESTTNNESQQNTQKKQKNSVDADALKRAVHDYLEHLTKKLTGNGILVAKKNKDALPMLGYSPVITNQIKRYNAILALNNKIDSKTTLNDDDIQQARKTVEICGKSRPAWSERPLLQRIIDILSFGIRPLYCSFFSKEVRLQKEIEHSIIPTIPKQ